MLDKLPSIQCSLQIVFPISCNPTFIENDFRQYGWDLGFFTQPKQGDVIVFTVFSSGYMKSPYLDRVLTALFEAVSNLVGKVNCIAQKYNGVVWIDVSIRSFGSTPGLALMGNNMRLIRVLEANISIDIFDN